MTPERADYPWLVVDTYGEQPPIGCRTEAAARALPGRITAPHEAGRWKAERMTNNGRTGA